MASLTKQVSEGGGGGGGGGVTPAKKRKSNDEAPLVAADGDVKQQQNPTYSLVMYGSEHFLLTHVEPDVKEALTRVTLEQNTTPIELRRQLMQLITNEWSSRTIRSGTIYRDVTVYTLPFPMFKLGESQAKVARSGTIALHSNFTHSPFLRLKP